MPANSAGKEEDADRERQEEQASASGRPACFSSTVQECLFVLTATMAIGQNSFYTGSITGVTASIGRDLNMNSAEITWINAGAACVPLFLYQDTVRFMFVAGMAGFTLALVVAGFATSAIYMDVFSGILGLFSAAVVPPAVGALGVVYEKPSKRKNRAFACFSAGNPLGFVGGMIISGIADHVANWRATFWALAVLYAIFTLLTVWTVPNDPPDGTAPWNWESFKKCDLPGMLLVVTGVSFFSSALSLAGDAPDGWRTGYVIALLILGIVAMAGFLYWQSVAAYPLMPLYVWRDRNFSLLMLMLCLGFMGFMSASFWLSLYLQEIKHSSAIEVAAQLLPMVINGILVNIVCGLVLHKVSNKLLMLIATTGYTASFLILSFMKEERHSYWAFIFPALILVVVGADIEFNVANMYVMSSLPPSDQSLAGGIFNTVTKLCNNISLGISTAVYNAVRDQNSGNAIRPYLATFWFSAVIAGLSMFMVPFLKLGTQGGGEKGELSDEADVEERTTAEKVSI
ncbi:MFS multidrug transporter [Rasamsonia emersonii CBS 393.64]|uniref:MFS multidrug transporter n=1 Tax=Rasamsonia emersonii (strain ATCC 16479 / CBS 393.64 / IMI 116815) TaxID=1408163 RepID=A0A0F4YKN5_RASE3|nr:MFS multidrug transporter [Rasamsonia emersonii CBS 393.64]KKA18857.1 MFS multidrug transporter [Rasamsonia emersonii CBS 393.64]